MNAYDIKRLALIHACIAEIEGMKSENETRADHGFSNAWNESSFFDKAVELRDLAYKHDEQL